MYSKSTQAYYDIITEEMEFILLPLTPKEKKTFGKIIKNQIIGIKTENKSKAKHSQKNYFIANSLFLPLSEILDSIKYLYNIHIYIGSFPYSEKKVLKHEFLRYHIENYLNEIYILKNRLISYLNILEKAYKKSERKDIIHTKFSSIYKTINYSFKGLVEIRGYHVHQTRYSDFDLERLSTIRQFLYSDNEKLNRFHGMYIIAYREIRKKWKSKIEKDLKAIDNLLELYFKTLIDTVTNNKKIIFPTEKWNPQL